MEIIKREEITEEIYREILDIETHHDHVIIVDKHDVIRWKENPDVNNILNKISLNDIVILFNSLGYNKNSEVYRKLYRDMGYSLSGYYDIFYWDFNNEKASDYIPNLK